MAFEYLQVWKLHNLPGQCLSVLSHPHRKKCFLMFFLNISLPLVLLQGTTGNSLMLSSSFPVSSNLCLFSLSPLPWIPPPSYACCSHGCFWPSRPQQATPCEHEVQHSTSLHWLSLNRGNYRQGTPGTSWISSVPLCCASRRCQSVWGHKNQVL